MKITLKLLAGALLSLSLVACTTYGGYAWRGGNPKFTTGMSAPSVTGVDAAAREASDR